MNESMIWLVPDLCGTIVNIKNHSLCSGRLSNKCRHDQCCALFHLTDDQINYVLSDIGSDIYLNSCPGSGKTEVIGVKVAYELSHWQSKTSGIAILTFTNSAEDEMYHISGIRYNTPISLAHLQVGFMDILPIPFLIAS